MAEFSGKVAIVTGGALGIGRVYTRRLVEEGARVVVADLDGTRAEEVAAEYAADAGERRVLGLQTDVADRGGAQRMVQATLDAFGRVDVLVNNAALFGALDFKPIEAIAVDEWDQVMAVNVRGVFLCCQAVVPHMRRQQYGRIVNVASGTLLSGIPNFLHYVTSKGAVFAFTRALAREVGQDGITVNTLAPGLVVTEAALRHHDPHIIARQHQLRAIPRDQVPEDLEGALVFLASDDSAFMTGQMVVVNGGAQFW